jgi:dTMP kinase
VAGDRVCDVTGGRGLFIAFEGGEGAGKSTQALLLRDWLTARGLTPVMTFEPGDTPVGKDLREILLRNETGDLSPRTEALLYAADRAEHVATVIKPALDAGSVVITDRYVDSSLAYQGAGRDLTVEDLDQLSAWATGGLLPDLTIVLDVDPAIGLTRFSTPADRLESEPLDFHIRVREQFLALAARAPGRYVVVDAGAAVDEIHAQVVATVEGRLA